ncbi:hypothetical protein ABT160_05655 [Streptomyces sp. NPDC001941]|uniref:hypothetical protein n=1 Tax=Streptomyces sp. NPDC001941 TaxID=3154659 RepID=UPI00333011B0
MARWFRRSEKSREARPDDPLTTADELRMAYGQTGDARLLTRAVHAAEEARDQYPADDPHHASSLSALCMLYRLRWEREHDARLLEQSVAYGRQAVVASPPSDPALGRHMSSLATSLQESFERTGRVKDIDEAIALYRGCLDLLEEGHHERAGQESNLANSLLRRAQRFPDADVLEEALTHARAALRHTPSRDPMHPVRLVNLGGALVGLVQNGQVQHVAEAQERYEQALREFPSAHPAYRSVQAAVERIRTLRGNLGI